MRPGTAAIGRLVVLSLTLALLGPSGCAGGKAEKWFHKGVRAHRNLDDRISYYSKAIALKPDYAFACNNRGLAYSKQGRHDKAIADLNKAIALLQTAGDKNNLAVAHDSRGIAHAKSGRHDLAIADYDMAIKSNPDYGLAYYNRGLAYKIKGRYDRAIRDYTEAIRLKPGYASAYINRSISRGETGRHDDAIADLNTAIALPKMAGDKPPFGVGLYQPGSVLSGEGRP